MPLQIVRENIVHMDTDAIVNAANSHLRAGGGVCGFVFDVAGFDEMKKACDEIGFCATGDAVITKGFKLKARYVIHAVGPIWRGGNADEEKMLRSCYRSALKIAASRQFESIAFPIISSGIYGYPKAEALSVAISEISEFLMENEMMIYIVVYDKASFELSRKLFNSVESYIDDNYVCTRNLYDHLKPLSAEELKNAESLFPTPVNIEYIMKNLDETFSEHLLKLIDQKGKTDVEIYKKANIDRKHFSKIRSNKDYRPTKPTILAFAIALELSLDETMSLLASAGYTFSRSSKFDVVIEYYINRKIYDIYEINNMLFAFDLPILM